MGKQKSNLKGCLYQRKGRWWWKVRLPGADKTKAIPLKPVGAKYATTDRAVAVEVAKLLWQKAIFKPEPEAVKVKTIAGLVRTYLAYAKRYYGPQSQEPENIKYALIPLTKNHADLPVEEFNSLHLKTLQQTMVGLKWSRGVINKRTNMIKRMFKWAASERILPVFVYQELQTVEGLRQGRSGARETQPVKPIAEKHIKAVLSYTSPTIAAMLQIQLLTGMRSGELCIMRPCDIDKSREIWYYRPETHKTAHRGHSRIVAIGPKAQQLIQPFLNRQPTEYCFTPAESESGRSHTPSKRVGNRYNKDTYYKAVQYAIKAANADGVAVPRFHPHQLRHTAATRIRKEAGLEATRAVLGHRNSKVTDDYAELDESLATDAMARLG